jgi:hypothetical protein
LTFSDYASGIRTIYGASDKEDILSETTALTSLNGFDLLGNIFFYTIGALLFGVVYSFAAIQLPLVATLVTSMLAKKSKYRVYIQNIAGAIAHLYFKILVARIIINHSEINFLQAKGLDNEVLMIAVLVSMTLLSLSLTFRYINKAKEYDEIMVSSFALFNIYEVIMFSLLQFIYVLTSLLKY